VATRLRFSGRTTWRDLVTWLTVDRHLGHVLDRPDRDRAYDRFPAHDALAVDRAGCSPEERVAVAEPLASQPRTVVLDEISQGLSPTIVAELLPAARAVAGEGAAVLLVEQLALPARAMAHRPALLDHGRLVYDGDVAAARSTTCTCACLGVRGAPPRPGVDPTLE
jgi:ABC-type branched-subunit amino acid transport system ATPase component